jgi:hypothetical protein
MGRGLEAGTERSRPANRGHERIATRIDLGRDAQCHLRKQRKPAARKFLSRLLAEHLRKPGMGAQAGEGPYRIAQGIAPRGLAMEGAGLREQFRRVAYEYLLLPAHTEQPCLEFNAGGFFRKRAAVWIQAGNFPAQREDGPHRDRHETWRPHGGGQADGNGFSDGACKND